MKKIYLLVALVIFTPFLTFSQKLPSYIQLKQSAFGIVGGLKYSMVNSEFSRIPLIPSCCDKRYDSKNAMGYYFSLLGSFPVPKFFTIDFRLGYSYGEADFSALTNLVVSLNGEAYNGIVNNKLNMQFYTFDFEPTLNFLLVDALKLNIGFNISLNSSNKYTESENLVEPSNITFENGSRTRLNISNNIPGNSDVYLSGVFGLSYDFPMNSLETFYISPEIKYFWGAKNKIDGTKLQLNYITFGVAFKFSSLTGRFLNPDFGE